MPDRYIIKPDPENEQFKILDMSSALGSEDKSNEWVATTYDGEEAAHICILLNRYKRQISVMNGRIDQLAQLAKNPVWDGNLIGKHERDELFKAGLVGRWGGWNFLTEEGVKYAVNLGIILP